ncbi:MAG: hypothetical protein AAB724_00600, partial [Patescibacteria group bacterium]
TGQASFTRSPPWAEPCPLIKLSVSESNGLALGIRLLSVLKPIGSPSVFLFDLGLTFLNKGIE